MASTPSNNPQTPAQAPTHLHYGGSLGKKSGKLGSKPKNAATFQTQKRLETMVRLENAGIGEAAAAAMLCISVPRLRTIKKTADYLSVRIQITHGIIINHERNLAQVKEQRKEILTAHLPSALQVLANELLTPAHSLAERKHKASIALELLDREGTFAKVSRTEIKPVDHFDFETADAESASIIAALRSAGGTVGTTGLKSQTVSAAGAAAAGDSENFAGATALEAHTEEAVRANQEFSNSHTLSAVDQQKALEALEEAAASEEAAGEVDAELLATLTPASEKVQ